MSQEWMTPTTATDPHESAAPEVAGHVIERLIARGGSGSVWAASDVMGQRVAVKVPHVVPEPADVQALDLERHVLMAVRHEHLVALRDVVGLADGRVALIFDLVDGPSLASVIATRGHLRPGETVTVLTPLCQAVETIHAAGAVHGDISTGNVAMTSDGRPRLLDLGAARLWGDQDEAHGTAGFIAPEVRAGDPSSTASDVFALGAVAWACLTGNGAPDTFERLDPDTIISHVGPELGEVIGAAIDPDPRVRPSAAELAVSIFAAAEAEPVEVVADWDPALALTHRIRSQAANEPRRDARSRRSPRWRRPELALVLAAVLPLLIGWRVVAHLNSAQAADAPPRVAASGAVPVPAVTGPPRVSPTSGARPAASPTAASAPAPSATSATASPPDALRDRAAAVGRPKELIVMLAANRAKALESGDPAALAAVDVPGGPASSHDTEVLSTLQKQGQRYAGLRYEIGAVTIVRPGQDSAVLRASIGTAAYDVVGPKGTTRMPAETAETVDLQLRYTTSGWRIWSIADVTATPAT